MDQASGKPRLRNTGTPPGASRRELFGQRGLLSRRELLRTSGRLLAASAALPPSLAHLVGPTTEDGKWGWALDANGDGVLDELDHNIVAAALGLRRGGRARPAPGWDPRADVLALGRVDEGHLSELNAALGRRLAPRPIVVCWHYGWYGHGRRRGEQATVSYAGGSYSSRDHRVEHEFNQLKEEFGVSADLLSWIDDASILTAYEHGYLRADNRDRRLTGLLYEAPINLQAEHRLDFRPEHPYAEKLVHDFRKMGHWFQHVGGSEARGLLQLDGRPVVYIFGSHIFGTTHRNLPYVGQALLRSREAFAEAFGRLPYLIGDESLFPADLAPGVDRLYRAPYFDAITRYHHYDEKHIRGLAAGGAVRLDAAHRRRLVSLERRTMRGYRGVHNRFTDAPLLVVPSSAAGFAKRHLPTLGASGDDYAALLRDMQALTDEHIGQLHARRIGTAALAAPLVFVGSWNEEFEGHALMPASSNQALIKPARAGLDWLYAIKSLYGWNHWAKSAQTTDGS